MYLDNATSGATAAPSAEVLQSWSLFFFPGSCKYFDCHLYYELCIYSTMQPNHVPCRILQDAGRIFCVVLQLKFHHTPSHLFLLLNGEAEETPLVSVSITTEANQATLSWIWQCVAVSTRPLCSYRVGGISVFFFFLYCCCGHKYVRNRLIFF